MEKLAKHWTVEYNTDFDGERASITSFTCTRISDGAQWSGNGLENLVDGLCARGCVFAWAWDISYLGGFLDYYALSRGLPHYKDAKKRRPHGSRGNYPTEECYSALYAAGRGVLNVRLTTRRKFMTHEYRSGKKGGLHTVEYRGLETFFGGHSYAEITAAMPEGDGNVLRRLFFLFAEKFSAICGEDVTEMAYLRKIYTIGGAAKRLYIRTRYGAGHDVRIYQKEHFAQCDMEYLLRERNLQLPGMCFYSRYAHGNLIEGRTLRKYDVNGLYSATANEVGELGYPRPSDFHEFVTSKDERYTFIIILKDLLAFRKLDMPRAFDENFGEDSDGDIIDIHGEVAIFRELFLALKAFYDMEEFEIVAVYKLEKRGDPAMLAYNGIVDAAKEKAGREGDKIGRIIAKGLLNNLIGKFTQKTIYQEIIPRYDKERDIVTFENGEIIDNWERGHFDYIRGAYIYTMARVRIMWDIAHLCHVDETTVDHHFYTDTDSIVTDVTFPEEIIDGVRIGAYKLEGEYQAFGVINKKVYYSRTVDGVDELVCAGIPKGLVLREIREAYGDGLTAAQIWTILNSDARYNVFCEYRVPGGVALLPVGVRVREIDISKEDIYGNQVAQQDVDVETATGIDLEVGGVESGTVPKGV